MLKKKTHGFHVFWAQGPWGPGPWSKAPGAHGTPIFSDFWKIDFMVWDLSSSVGMVFRSPGIPLINLFHFILNSKCHFLKVSLFIQLPIEFPIVLPIVLYCNSIGNSIGNGGERGNFMHSYHNFSLVNQKRMLEVFVHTNFSIRVFWERRDM